MFRSVNSSDGWELDEIKQKNLGSAYPRIPSGGKVKWKLKSMRNEFEKISFILHIKNREWKEIVTNIVDFSSIPRIPHRNSSSHLFVSLNKYFDHPLHHLIRVPFRRFFDPFYHEWMSTKKRNWKESFSIHPTIISVEDIGNKSCLIKRRTIDWIILSIEKNLDSFYQKEWKSTQKGSRFNVFLIFRSD